MDIFEIRALWLSSEEVAKCPHKNATICRRIYKNKSLAILKQCWDCGAPIEQPLKQETYSKEQIDEMPAWDTCFDATELGEKVMQWAKDRDNTLADERRRKQARYEAYRATPEWKKRRDAVILRAQGICEGCRERKAEDVHHTTYNNITTEFLFELVALCHQCHERLHGRGEPTLSPSTRDLSLSSSRQSAGAPMPEQEEDRPF